MTENYMLVTAPGAEVSVAPIDSETKAPSPVLTFHQVSTDDRRESETSADRRRHLENKTDRQTDKQKRIVDGLPLSDFCFGGRLLTLRPDHHRH